MSSHVDYWPHAIAAIKKIADLKDDWDGEGSPAPPTEVIDAATKEAEKFRSAVKESPTRVVVTVNGTVAFEWWGVFDDYEEVEIISSNVIEIRRRLLGRREWE